MMSRIRKSHWVRLFSPIVLSQKVYLRMLCLLSPYLFVSCIFAHTIWGHLWNFVRNSPNNFVKTVVVGYLRDWLLVELHELEERIGGEWRKAPCFQAYELILCATLLLSGLRAQKYNGCPTSTSIVSVNWFPDDAFRYRVCINQLQNMYVNHKGSS